MKSLKEAFCMSVYGFVHRRKQAACIQKTFEIMTLKRRHFFFPQIIIAVSQLIVDVALSGGSRFQEFIHYQSLCKQ